jgi:inosine-uridine nucleoside N-ribohydrolase
MRQKVICDVDTGGDDAIAVLAVGHSPRTELVAVTVVAGNAPLEVTLENTLKVVEHGGLCHVPVYAGATHPLISALPPLDSTQERRLRLPAPTLRAQSKRAAEFLVDYYMSDAGPETILVPTAPLTNLALALRLEPRIAQRIPRIVTMGGAYLEGNTTPSAEFNIYADPEAAHIVYSAGIPITMVGLEVTGQALITLEDAARIHSFGTPQARIAGDLIAEEVQWFMDHLGWHSGQVYDACAAVGAIESSVIKTRRMHVAIELTGTLTRGRTVADISGNHYNSKPPNVEVGVGIDRERFMRLLEEALSQTQAPPAQNRC